ncbi:hypothetical protein PF005_g26918 [Phytophthora fragariae]|uniref:Uncharacterized protein n=1 Tax=Phytophthora fragariae TaxID=53985 RepID=A0A6A3Q7P2_9STRA|nr:hypothetical protein PF003_g31295 [Phytophthora fragariae]KAE8923532.1 hypothetical protein PF009_g26220 [Phytophthora fragariae]KAE9070325.1 hypothetical protein PF007_g26979 [Phytophthora fragariae]KAE9171982.1 hypothetical protein PF005_g26918 [Phytophthora fragariae]KAE9177359.1 hypothetical protein PF004_g25798 [Phytophthora fragariae]
MDATSPMYDVVHLDEKWFYMKKVAGKHVPSWDLS